MAVTASGAPITSASTLPSVRFLTQPRSPRLAAVRVAQNRLHLAGDAEPYCFDRRGHSGPKPDDIPALTREMIKLFEAARGRRQAA